MDFRPPTRGAVSKTVAFESPQSHRTRTPRSASTPAQASQRNADTSVALGAYRNCETARQQYGHAKSTHHVFPPGLVASSMGTSAWKERDSGLEGRLDGDVLSRIQAALRAYVDAGGKGRNEDMLLKRLDRNGSGSLDFDAVRSVFRRYLRVPPAAVSDAELRAFVKKLHDAKAGKASVYDVVEFMNRTPFARPSRRNQNAAKFGNAGFMELDDHGQTTTLAPENDMGLVGSAMSSLRWRDKATPRSVLLTSDDFKLVKTTMVGNSYARKPHELVASYVDSRTGTLDREAFRKMLRSGFRVPRLVFDDAGIYSLFESLVSRGNRSLHADDQRIDSHDFLRFVSSP